MFLFETKQFATLGCDDEWKAWERIGDPVEHIVLRDWADICIVAPLSAHTLAKIAHGLCDDTLSCIIRAWDFGNRRNNNPRAGKPMILAPAMNTAMWEHPITAQQISQMESFGRNVTSEEVDHRDNLIRIVEPQSKKLACGEVGVGAMADVGLIVNVVQDLFKKRVCD
jgi:phosphopantothenoylcysteine decarboxylase